MNIRNTRIRPVTAGVVVAILCIAAYVAGQAGTGRPASIGSVGGNPPGPDILPVGGPKPDTFRHWWFAHYSYEQSRLPRYDQVVAGIELGPNIDGRPLCTAFERVTEERLVGTPLEISPAFLPVGTVENASSRESSTCEGSPHASTRYYSIATDEAEMALVRAGKMFFFDAQHGGNFEIMRLRTDRPRFSSDFPSGRFKAGTVAGRPAAIGPPIVPRAGAWSRCGSGMRRPECSRPSAGAPLGLLTSSRSRRACSPTVPDPPQS